MNLNFSLTHNGKPTHFPEKILSGLYSSGMVNHELLNGLFEGYLNDITKNNFFDKKVFWDDNLPDKIHTIRKDEKNRWKAGMYIHFVVNPYNKNRCQFAPVLPVISTQQIEIDIHTETVRVFDHWIGGLPENSILTPQQIEELAHNDGFDTVADFWDYFNEPFIGKIIHWTNKTYK